MFRNALSRPAEQALGIIKGIPSLQPFYLAGGTAAALQLGHRISVDLDFFSHTPFDPDELARNFASSQVLIDQQQTSPGTLKGMLAGAQLSFFFYPYETVEPLVPCEGIMLAGLIDIGLMKMTAIGSRGARRDFVDLYFILKSLGRTDLFDLFQKKFPSQRLNLYHYARSLVHFDDADRQAEPMMLVNSDWNEIKVFFRASIKTLQLR